MYGRQGLKWCYACRMSENECPKLHFRLNSGVIIVCHRKEIEFLFQDWYSCCALKRTQRTTIIVLRLNRNCLNPVSYYVDMANWCNVEETWPIRVIIIYKRNFTSDCIVCCLCNVLGWDFWETLSQRFRGSCGVWKKVPGQPAFWLASINTRYRAESLT